MKTANFLITLTLLTNMAIAETAADKKEFAANCNTEQHRQFDFWIGNWKVHDKDGKLLGHNRIERILQGCALKENWTGGSGFIGTSLNTYDSANKQWRQFWVDASGTVLQLSGKFENNKMVLTGHQPSSKDPKILVIQRISWEPLKNDTVRQLWDFSNDNSKTWTVLFDGIYSRD